MPRGHVLRDDLTATVLASGLLDLPVKSLVLL